ncbi:hypothetical protein, partial [Phocaeicola dorei]
VQYGVEYITCEVSLTARIFFEKKDTKLSKYRSTRRINWN